MVYTKDIGKSVRKVRGLLEALGLEKQISIAYDEWNLRQWYHPNIMELYQGLTKEEYLKPRDDNDINRSYTSVKNKYDAYTLLDVLDIFQEEGRIEVKKLKPIRKPKWRRIIRKMWIIMNHK